ncbi:hypothetical protein OO014_00560 [Intrasporangium calvum]|uniref:Secreted protein n=1 Tax=Intrasporangium calvum TaxID=53358 RepID=A0ABT5GBT7_9MICO|nr:hypothetical protein [Intrasporangium calvum]MDC5695735.1 hypothetical protein [Intrasporangium calvum]
MKSLHRVIPAFVAVLVAALLTAILPTTASAASAATPARTPVARPATQPAGQPAQPAAAPVEATADSASVNCSNVRELGTSKVVRDKGMSAFTVRQYIGWCWDSSGSAWMNFASVYVWAQYHNLGFGYRPQAGIVVGGSTDTRGYTVGDNRQRLTYSTPVRTTQSCTQGWGKLLRGGSESDQGLTSLVC